MSRGAIQQRTPRASIASQTASATSRSSLAWLMKTRPLNAGSLQCFEECQQVGFFAPGQPDPEARVVEIDGVGQARGRAVVEVGSARRERTQDRSFELADVVPFPGHHRAPRV